MPKIKITAANAASLPYVTGTKTDYYDIGSPLILEVRRSGGRTWYVRYTDRYGKMRQPKIAPYGDLTFEQAKKRAQHIRSEALLGGDPMAEKAALKAIPTYAELAEQHLAFAKTHLREWQSVEMILRVHIKPKWGKVRLAEITPQQVGTWLAEKAKAGLAPATVEKIRTVMSRSFSLGAKHGVAGCDRNPVHAVPRRSFDNARTRFLDAAEVKRLLDAAAGSKNRQLMPIITLLVTTGARKSEILTAEWANVDLERRTLFLPMTKNGRSRHVPLPTPAVLTLEALKETRKAGAKYVFPSRFDPKKPLGSIKHAWQTACREAKLPDTHIHDLRHTAASAMIAAGFDLYSVGTVLGHRSHASTARYAHVANTRLQAAVEAGAAGLFSS